MRLQIFPRVALAFALCLAAPALHAAQPAFPEAEGFGKNVTGGRGGTVYHVTNLNDTGAGSLRNASALSNVTIVFDVGGYIQAGSKLGFTGSNITVAGQTAPGGIGIKGAQVSVGADNIIVRHIRARCGKAVVRSDAFSLNSNVNGAIFDHCSFEFATDENNSMDNPVNVTGQWTFNGWGLQTHSAGALLYAQNVTLHHYLYAHNHTRNPKSRNGLLDYVNNTIFDFDIPFICADTTAGTHWANVDRCYFISGYTGQSKAFTSAQLDSTSGLPVYHMWLNQTLTDFDANGALNGTDKGYSVISGTVEQHPARYPEAPQVTTQDPLTAHKLLMSLGGATPWERDEVDTLLVSDVMTQHHRIITRESDLGLTNSGFGTLGGQSAPSDSDGDGIPNYFEEAMGFNKGSADNNADKNGDGYTNLEEYLNWLAAPHATVNAGGFIDVDLKKLTAGFGAAATYSVANPVNGTVALQGASTARFTSPAGSTGLCGFSFTVNDGSTATIPVSVLTVPVNTDLVYSVNSGGPAVSGFAADANFSGGSTYSNTGAIDVSRVADPAPTAVYQSERNKATTYTIPGLTAGSNYTVRLHFAEIFFSAAGLRQFNVLINGTQVLSNYDIYGKTGGRYIATVEEFAATANPSGQIVIQFVNVIDNAKISGIEILVRHATSTTINAESTRAVFSGAAAANDAGTVWNSLGSTSAATTATVNNASDSTGKTTSSAITLSSSGTSIKTFIDATAGAPAPLNLMQDYFYGNTYTVTVGNLKPGDWQLYAYAHGNVQNQVSTVTLGAANGGATGVTTQASAASFRSITAAPTDAYVKLNATVPDEGSGSGSLTFTANPILNGFQLTPVKDAMPPAAPTGLTAVAGDAKVTLNWNDNTEADFAGYSVKRATVSGGPYTAVATNLSASAHVDNSVNNGTTYYYVVSALDVSNNESSYSAEVSATPLDTAPPAAPTGLTAIVGTTGVALNWADNSDGDLASYKVKRATVASGPFVAVATGIVPSDYKDASAAANTVYFYVVTAVDSSGNESGPSILVSSTIPAAHWRLNETAGSIAHNVGSSALDGALNNMSAAAWSPGKFGNGLTFDGVDDYVLIPHNGAIDFGTASFTLCFWLKHAATTATSGEEGIIEKGTIGNTTTTGKRYNVYTKAGSLFFSIDDNDIKTQIGYTTASFHTGAWVFAAAIRDAETGEVRLYANAAQVAADADGTGDISQTEPMYVGRYAPDAAGPSYMNGQLDDIRVYPFVLSPAQLDAVMSGKDEAGVNAATDWLLYR